MVTAREGQRPKISCRFEAPCQATGLAGCPRYPVCFVRPVLAANRVIPLRLERLTMPQAETCRYPLMRCQCGPTVQVEGEPIAIEIGHCTTVAAIRKTFV